MMKSALPVFGLLSLLPAALLAQNDFNFDNLEEEFSNEFGETECGKALLAFAETYRDAQQGSCTTAFEGVDDFLSFIPVPDVGFGGINLGVDFSLPNNITDLIPDAADVLTQCDTGGCVEAVTEALDEVDAKCAEGAVLSSVLTPGTYANIRKIRAIVSVYCLSDAAGDLCFTSAFDSFPSTAEGIFSGFSLEGLGGAPSAREAPSSRDSLCSVCSRAVQQGLFAAYEFDADANNFYMLSRLACLKDTNTKEFCQPKDLMVDGFGFVQLQGLWNTLFNEEDLCGSSCAIQAISVLSPRLSESKVFPDGCYEPLSEPIFGSFSLDGLGNLPSDIGLDTLLERDTFDLGNGTEISVSELVGSVEDDVEEGLGLPPGSVEVNLTDYVDGEPTFGYKVLETVPEVDDIADGGYVDEIPSLPFQKTNSEFPALAESPTRSFSAVRVASSSTSASPSATPTAGPTEDTSGASTIGPLVSFVALLALSLGAAVC